MQSNQDIATPGQNNGLSRPLDNEGNATELAVRMPAGNGQFKKTK